MSLRIPINFPVQNSLIGRTNNLVPETLEQKRAFADIENSYICSLEYDGEPVLSKYAADVPLLVYRITWRTTLKEREL